MELEAKKEIEKEEKKKTDIKQKEFKEKKKSEEKIKQEVKEIEQKEIQPEESTNTSTNDTFNEKEINDSQTEEHEASNLEYNSNEEFIFTLSGEIDKKFEVYQKYLQQEVQRLWSPPLGVPKGTTCRIKFVIDQSGKVSNFENIKKSKVLIYDLSILRIAHQFKFDKCLWGKSFIIDFCQ